MAEVAVRAPSRLHFGLLDLSNATPRKYGGAGVMLDQPNTTVHACAGAAFHVDPSGVAPEYLEAVRQAASRLEKATRRLRCNVTIDQTAPPHVGLGSKTSTVLATLTAVNAAEGLALSAGDLQVISGRGGTSGVGVNGFFIGGFIVDAGHEQGGTFGPSSDGPPEQIPPVLSHFRVPSSWRFALVLPEGKRLSGADERAFFAENTPIPKAESLAAIALVHHGLAPGFLTGDLQSVRAATAEIQLVGFKRREVEAQSDQVRGLLSSLAEIDSVASGLSSIGPLVYAIHDAADTDALLAIKRQATAVGAEFLGDASASESGVEMNVSN